MKLAIGRVLIRRAYSYLLTWSVLTMVLSVSFSVNAEVQGMWAEDVRSEIRSFMSGYQRELQLHSRKAISDRYHISGTHLVINGKHTFESHKKIESVYMGSWQGPRSIRFKKMTVEVLAPTVAMVFGDYTWEDYRGVKKLLFFNGLLVKEPSGWKIRVESVTEKRQKR